MNASQEIERSLKQPSATIQKFLAVLQTRDNRALMSKLEAAQALTRRHFGRTMRLFAPLYVSNECINNCQYCGFSRDNPILRTTLSRDEVVAEGQHLAREGFRQVLIVAGEHPRFVSNGYLESCVRDLIDDFPSVALEVAPMEAEDYRPLVRAGAEALVVYQETYDREIYKTVHTSGPKKDYDWRLACPERAYQAGFRRIGIGALLGMAPWHSEALRLAAHLEYLQKRCWRAMFTISLPRLRPAAGCYEPPHPVSDADFVRLILAFRLAFPEVGIVLSTRESPELRQALWSTAITHMSAGSHTEPGGYTGQGKSRLHTTVRGREVENALSNGEATAQFEIADHRSASEISRLLQADGLEPVWKDWQPFEPKEAACANS